MKLFDANIDAAIFDMDGTMFDTERLRIKMLKQASKEIFDIEIEDDLLFDSLGVSAVTAEKLAKKRYGEHYPYYKIRERADELELDYVRKNGVPVKEGLYNLLERLKRNQVLIALATSSRREIAEEYLIRAKVLRYFDILVYGDEVEKGKPDPEIFSKAINELCCNPDKCIVLEDSTNGMIAAHEAGSLPVFIKDMIDIPPKVKKYAFRSYTKMTDLLTDIIPFTKKQEMPELYEGFPISMDHNVVGIHGFGAIGGGYLAQIFSHWDGYTRPSKIIGATNGLVIRQLVNSIGRYRVKYESVAYFQTINNVHIIDINNEEEMMDMYIQSSIIGLALPEQIIPLQAEMIAKCLKNRYDNGYDNLTILIVMNKINAVRFVKRQVNNALKQITDEKSAKKILKRTDFSETVVNRMVSPIMQDVLITKIYNDLKYLYENIIEYTDDIKNLFDFSLSQIETKSKKRKSKKIIKKETELKSISVSENLAAVSAFANKLSELNITLYSAEPDMPIYASRAGNIIDRLRQVVVLDDINPMQEIKNKLSNGTHAIIAWYGNLLGYETIGQSMGDKRIEKVALQIMKNEIRPALLSQNPELKTYINSFIIHFIKRCRVSFKDKCTRVGRDPMRKLQNGERIIGAIQLAEKYQTSTKWLEFGAACAILYSIKFSGIADREAKKIREIYEINHSVEDILTYNGPYNKTTYKGLDPNNDKDLISRIANHVKEIAEELSVSL